MEKEDTFDPEYVFGVLTIDIAKRGPISKEIIVDSNIDISASMDQLVGQSNQTKIHFAKLTYKNIATALSKEKDASVYLSIHGFDHDIEEILKDTKITSENIEEINRKIDLLQPRGSTNIDRAIQYQQKRQESRETKSRKVNITITDGEITAGEKSYEKIKERIAPGSQNYYIAYGSKHNCVGLQTLAEAHPRSGYYYVAEVEFAYLAFGDILNKILYTVVEDGVVEATEGEIYDMATNTWTTTKRVDEFTSEQKMVLYVRSKNPQEFRVNIRGRRIQEQEEEEEELLEEDIEELPLLIDEQTNTAETKDLSSHMFKQRLQEYIFKTHQHNKNPQDTPDFNTTTLTEMNKFRDFLQFFKTEKGLDLDEIIADLDMTLKTLGGPRSFLYSAAKYNTHSQNRGHTVNTIEREDYEPLQRQNACFIRTPHTTNTDHPQYQSQSIKLGRAFSDNTTPTQMSMTRQLSDGMGKNADDDDEEP
jgi:hypothetical protein